PGRDADRPGRHRQDHPRHTRRPPGRRGVSRWAAVRPAARHDRYPRRAGRRAGTLLCDLGVAGSALPEGVDDRARLYRTRLAGRRIPGARLAARPHWPLAHLAARLHDADRRLDELRTGDLAVRRSLAVSYAGIGDAARRALRRLSLLDVADVAAWIVAALLDRA